MSNTIKLGAALLFAFVGLGCESIVFDEESFRREGKCIRVNIIRDNNFDIEGCLDFTDAGDGNIVILPDIEEEVNEALDEEE